MMLRLFYRLNPFIPRSVQIKLRRVRASRILAGLNGNVIDESGLSACRFSWPAPYTSAILVTHDVELSGGQANIPALLEIEKRLGVRSCWNFVVDRYPVDEELISRLIEGGHEVGVHGVKHDGKLFSSETVFRDRLKIMEAAADRWHAKGFRSPALLHDLALMSELRFSWDSSLPAWDPFQPMPGGCGRYAPFMLNERCVELPVTLWQDFTLFEELDVDPLEIWKCQTIAIINAGGLVNLIVHPDYLLDRQRLAVYEQLLGFLVEQDRAWLTVPSAIADWTRDRLRRT